MVLLDPIAAFEYGAQLTLRMAGAESNVAIALSRLGVPARWISRLGTDPLGDMIFEALARERVDTSGVIRDPRAPTGLFYKLRRGGRTTVGYYRAGSAASRMHIPDVPDESLDGVELVHLTGITLGISRSARAMVVDLARRAHARGIIVVFDPNWREALWPDPAAARVACAEVLPYVNWVLCGDEEGRLLFGGPKPTDTIAAIRDLGAGDAVVRVGERGAVMRGCDGALTVGPERTVEIVDEVGAGDAFAAGFIYGQLEDLATIDCVRMANRLAGAALEGPGDWETLPHEVPAATGAGRPPARPAS